jgi:hypothetical protein
MQNSTQKFDCVYYWVGGSEYGEWKRADAGTRDTVRNMGYVAHDGITSIGPPEDAPTKEELSWVLGRGYFYR